MSPVTEATGQVCLLFLLTLVVWTSAEVKCPETALQEERVSVPVGNGSVSGLVLQTIFGKKYYSFRGIPYAQPPVGPLRFQSPQPLDIEGEVDASKDGPQCMQSGGGQEDCLYINVYTTQLRTDGLPPAVVMVYIHGGGLFAGSSDSSSLGPDFLLESGIILVTLNYRLGPLGFMSTEDHVMPGNLGFKDQRLALRWVQKNIANFGGDPTRVTLFGESAGSVSVSYHLLSPTSKGLFQRAILESGSGLSPRGYAKTARDRAFRLARALGADPQSSQDLLDFMLTVDAADLVSDDSRALSDEDKRRFETFVWLPTAEPPSADAFLLDATTTLYGTGVFNTDVDIIAGTNSAECLGTVIAHGVLADPEVTIDLNQNFEEILFRDIRTDDDEVTKREAARKVREFYFGQRNITSDSFMDLVNLFSDLYYIEPVDMLVRAVANRTSRKVFYYQFDYKGSASPFPEYPVVNHADELQFIFYNKGTLQQLEPTSPDGVTVTRMVTLWTNFAKYGNPTPEPLENVTWCEYGGDLQRNYLHISNSLEMRQRVYSDRMEFMHGILPLPTQ